jgi:hypothetical protein
MSRPSVAQQLERMSTRAEAPTGDYFYDKLPAEPQPRSPARQRFLSVESFAALAKVQVKTVRASSKKRLAGAFSQERIDLAHPDTIAYLARKGVVEVEQPGPSVVGPWHSDTLAMAQLRWFFSQSGGELGEKSSLDSLIMRIASGGGGATSYELIAGEVTSRTPTDWRLHAAERFRLIRSYLLQLTPEHQAVLEMTYSLRRPDPQIRALLKGFERLEPVVSYLVRTKQLSFKRASAGPDLATVCDGASRLLADATAAYEVAAGIASPSLPPGLQKAPKRPRGGRSVGLLVPVGARGASKRRWIPVEPVA